jgi:hypothetical protein
MKQVFLFIAILLLISSVCLHADTGTVSGRILLDREAPPLPEIVVDKTVEFCGETLMDTLLMVQNSGIQGAVISIDWNGEPFTDLTLRDPIHLQSRGCLFHPRIQATRLGNDLVLKSGDEITHNPHGWWNNKKTIFNITLLNPNQTFKRKFRWAGTYRIECDTHTWMKAYILVFEHPFYTVSGEEGGFKLENIPIGTYTIRVWHEVLGEQTETVVVKPQTVIQKDFVMPLVDKRRKELIPKTVSPWPPQRHTSTPKDQQ